MYTSKMKDGDMPFGVGVLVAKDGGFLCGVRNDSGMIGGPGGFIKAGETPLQAAVRETREEFGIEPKGLVELGALKNNNGLYSPTIVFLCVDYDGELRCRDGEMSLPLFCTMEDLRDNNVEKFPAFEDSLQMLQDRLDEIEANEDQPKVEPAQERPEQRLTASENPVRKKGKHLVSPLDKGQEKLKEKFGNARKIAISYEPKFPNDAELSYKNAVGEYLESLGEVLDTEMQKIVAAYENDNPEERQDSMFGEFGDVVDKFVKAVATAAGIIITEKVIKKLKKIAEKVRKNNVREWADSLGEALDIDIDESYYDEDYFSDLIEEWEENNIEYVENTTGKMIDDMAGDFMDLFIAGTAVTVLTTQLDRRKQQALNHLSFITGDQISKLDAAMRQMEMVDSMSNEYIWRTRMDDRVRPRHRELEGQRFSYDDPPIMDSGEACNPGEDYNCRCYAEPVFDLTSLILPIIGGVHDSFFPGELEAVKSEKDVKDGGPGSGNWGHAGRPGYEGGSASGGGKAYRLAKPGGGYTGLVWAYRANAAYNKGGKEALVKNLNEPEGTFSGKAAPKKAAKVETSDFPSAFSAGKKNRESTQRLVDHINNCEGADPAVVDLYKKMAAQVDSEGNEIPIKVSHTKDSYFKRVVNGYGKVVGMEVHSPLITEENEKGAVQTVLHEYGHMLDFLFRDDKSSKHMLSSAHSEVGKKLSEAIEKCKISGYSEIPPKCKALIDEGRNIVKNASNTAQTEYNNGVNGLRQKYFKDGKVDLWSPNYETYVKECGKLEKAVQADKSVKQRNELYGLNNLSDIFDALSGGNLFSSSSGCGGHGMSYYMYSGNKSAEIVANYFTLSVTRPDLIKVLNAEVPELGSAMNDLIAAMNG